MWQMETPFPNEIDVEIILPARLMTDQLFTLWEKRRKKKKKPCLSMKTVSSLHTDELMYLPHFLINT